MLSMDRVHSTLEHARGTLTPLSDSCLVNPVREITCEHVTKSPVALLHHAASVLMHISHICLLARNSWPSRLTCILL